MDFIVCGVTRHAKSFISSPAASAQGPLGVIVKAHMCVCMCVDIVVGMCAVRCSNIGQWLCSENYGIRTKKNIILCEESYTARGCVCVCVCVFAEEEVLKPYSVRHRRRDTTDGWS